MKTKTKAKGFTLLEVMVALAIVGVALPAFLFQIMGQTDQTAYLRDKAFAQWVAQNKMVEIRLLKQIKGETFKGNDSGDMEMAGVSWKWSLSSEKTPFAENFRRIKISVSQGDQEEVLVTLEGIMSE